MVALSRARPVDSLLSRFRPAPLQPHAESPQMAVANAQPSPAGGHGLLSRAVTLQETRSQTDRRARADAGDLQARLDLIPLNVVEDHLSRSFRTAQPECSILDCLRGSGDALESYQAASVVLEELADATEQAAFTSALVYRYIQANALWRGHPDPNVTSAEAFLETLDNSDYVKANIFIGSSADHSKKKSLQVIAHEWGSDWFEKIPRELCDPAWVRAEECSKRLLGQMARSARKGYTFDEAVSHWTRSMQRRTDETARAEHGIRLPRSLHIILDDVRSLNDKARDDSDPRSISQPDVPDIPKDDRLKVELVAPMAASPRPAKKPDHSAARPFRAPKKRKRDVSEKTVETLSDEESTEENDGWRLLNNGKEMVKRVGNSLVHKPIDITSSEPQPPQAPPSAQKPNPSHQLRTVNDKPHSPPTCDGPAVALLLHKFIEAFRDMPALNNDPDADHRCCETCRPKALRAFKALEEVLLPCAEALEEVETHRYSDADVEASQVDDISPRKGGMVRKHASLFIEDSSDDE